MQSLEHNTYTHIYIYSLCNFHSFFHKLQLKSKCCSHLIHPPKLEKAKKLGIKASRFC